MIFRKFIAFNLAFFFVFLITACGVRGNLYLPDDPSKGKKQHDGNENIFSDEKNEIEK